MVYDLGPVLPNHGESDGKVEAGITQLFNSNEANLQTSTNSGAKELQALSPEPCKNSKLQTP